MFSVESVCYEVNKRYLLKDISFTMRHGEMIAVLGANGAGKSTLMRLLCGEKQPASGKIILDGKEPGQYNQRELALKRAMLQQQNTVSLPFTVREVVMMGRYGKFGSTPLARDQQAVEETMNVCGLSRLADRSMLTLSGGEQQRVHFARVLAQLWDSQNPLLLLDEPISCMDVQYQHQTLAIAAALAKRGFMVITVLHDINLAAQYASRIMILKDGRKWWDGRPAEVLTSSHIFTAFSINCRVYTDYESLATQIIPTEVRLDAADFNSNIPKEQKTEQGIFTITP